MRKKRILMLIGSVCLAVMLLVPLAASCGPATPEEAAEEIAELESKLAAEKAKSAGLEDDVADLEEEIAELRAPAEVTKILLEVGVLGGISELAAEYFKDNVAEASGGRMEVELVLGEAITPTLEHLEATGEGVFEMLLTWHPYFRKKIPLLDITVYDSICLRTREDAWTMYEIKGWGELMEQEFNKLNVHRLFNFPQVPGSFLVSRVPIPDFASLKGMKVRGTGLNGMILSEAGASVVVLSGGELYSSLASGLIEACHYAAPASVYDMGLHEVSKYWIMPPISKQNEYGFDANMDFWNNLSDTDQALIYNVTVDSLVKASFDDWYDSMEALTKAQEEGITVQYWDEESVKQWTAAGLKVAPEPRDEASTLARDMLFDYMRSMGYID